MTEQKIRIDDGEAYEQMMGIWSRSVGEVFLDWLAPLPGLRWIDVGCGNGAFTEVLVERCAPVEVQGIDPSEGQLAFARTRPASLVRAPVYLTEPHGAATLVCIVGNAVIWDRAVPPEAVTLEPALLRFAAAAHLSFFEVAVAPVRGGLAIVAVDSLPRLERYAAPACARILDALVILLTMEGTVMAPAARIVS